MRDLRLPVLGLAAWVGGLMAPIVPGHLVACLLLLFLLAGAALAVPARLRATALAVVVVLAAVTAVAAVRGWQTRHNPVAELAARQAQADVIGTVSSDPRLVVETHDTQQLLDLTVHRVTGRGSTYSLRTTVIVLGGDAWAGVPLGAEVRVRGELVPADDGVAGLLLAQSDPDVLARPSIWWRASGAVRSSVRAAVAGRPVEQRALVPALVDGDVSAMPPDLVEDFRTTGLTHLTAVSGTNLTLLVGFVLVVARWCRVRGRWLYVVGAVGIAGFVLLARTDASVLRAAVMGAIGLLAMSHDGRHRALRALGGATLVLLLVDPGLARSIGFALSVLATVGILLLAPAWRDALGRWLPRWLAEAIAVPAAAQLACTPLIAAISGQVSLVAVLANLLAEPAVGPATVLGLLGGVLALIYVPLGRLVAWPASWSVGWILLVAHRCAALPTAAFGWGGGPLALVVLTALTVLVALYAPRVLRHRVAGTACCLLLVVVMLIRLPTPGWPPTGWVMVMCDVGQGDGLVVSVGEHAALVVDAGPDPAPMDRCLDGLHIEQVPLVLFTHFDADHVDGASAVFDGRHVGEVWTTELQQPPHGVEMVDEPAEKAGLTPSIAPWGRTVRIGTATIQVLWPRTDLPLPAGTGTATNQASVVLLVHDDGLSLLLTGDLEPESAAMIAAEVPGLHVDVLKVPHHGSKYQDFPWLVSLHPEVALTSVGADNDYGHPAPVTMDTLAAAGIRVYRTDQDGSLAVVPGPAGPRVVAHR